MKGGGTRSSTCKTSDVTFSSHAFIKDSVLPQDYNTQTPGSRRPGRGQPCPLPFGSRFHPRGAGDNTEVSKGKLRGVHKSLQLDHLVRSERDHNAPQQRGQFNVQLRTRIFSIKVADQKANISLFVFDKVERAKRNLHPSFMYVILLAASCAFIFLI